MIMGGRIKDREGKVVVSGKRHASRVDSNAGLLDLRARIRVDVGVLARVQAEDVVVHTAELPQEEEQEERARNDVEDAVPDHLGARRDDVRALGQGPADRVRDEHEGEVDRGEDVALAERACLGERAAGCLPEEDPPVRSV